MKATSSKKQSSLLRKTCLGLFVLLAFLITGTTVYLASTHSDILAFYSNLANPYMRFVYIPSGLRKEEVAARFQKALGWNQKQVTEFLQSAPKEGNISLDGYYMPGTYWVSVNSTGIDVAHTMLQQFDSVVSSQVLGQGLASSTSVEGLLQTYGAKNVTSVAMATRVKNSKNLSSNKISLDTAIRIASIIQREAAGPQDMNIISGVIWNRIFGGIRLDMDSTLQYAKGNQNDWWPQVTGKDKYIDSPYNTYQNGGLPPSAIANPSLAAIEAAYNPAKTNCIFYLHDKDGNIHCTSSYEVQKENVQKYLVGMK